MLFTTQESQAILERSGLDKVLSARTFEMVERMYSDPSRHYHNWQHALYVLSWVNHLEDNLANTTPLPYSFLDLKLAALFHDVVYDKEGSPSNEARSTLIAQEAIQKAPSSYELSPARRTRAIKDVGELIMYTAQHGKLDGQSVPMGARLFLDCDIANFGEYRWETVVWNNTNVELELRQKYTPEEIAVGRKAFLSGLLANASIFQSEYFQVRFEVQARRNIRRLLAEGAQVK